MQHLSFLPAINDLSHDVCLNCLGHNGGRTSANCFLDPARTRTGCRKQYQGVKYDQRIQGACIPPKAADLRVLLQLLLRTQPSTSKPTVHSKRQSLSVDPRLRLNEQLSAASNQAWATRRSEQRLSRRRQLEQFPELHRGPKRDHASPNGHSSSQIHPRRDCLDQRMPSRSQCATQARSASEEQSQAVSTATILQALGGESRMVGSHLRQRAAGDQGSIGCLSARADHESGSGNGRREQGTGVDGARADDVGSASWKVGGGCSEGGQVVQEDCLGPQYYRDCDSEHDPPLSCKRRDI